MRLLIVSYRCRTRSLPDVMDIGVGTWATTELSEQPHPDLPYGWFGRAFDVSEGEMLWFVVFRKQAGESTPLFRTPPLVPREGASCKFAVDGVWLVVGGAEPSEDI